MSSLSPDRQNFDDAARQADILQRVIASINSGLALEPLLSNILESAITLIKATHGTIGLVVDRSEGPAIKTVAVHNMPAEEMGAEMLPGVGLAGHVLKTGMTIRLDRYGDLNQPTLPELANHSVIGVPIRWGDEMIGFFGLGNESPNRFSERDAETLELFAQYAAIAINNANLFEASQHALDEMRMLYETSQRIGLSVDVDEVIDAYLDQVAAGGEYVCNICLYEFDARGQRVAVLVKGRWSPQTGSQRLEERLPYEYDELDPVLDAGQTISISDVRTDSRVSRSLREIQEGSGRLALAMIPLMVRGQRIGLVVLSHAGVHRWSEDSLRPFRATAAQLAIAIDHRMQQNLLYERGQQLAVLHERQRLARELHDSVTQLIFSSTLIAQSISTAWKRDPREGEKRVERLLELSQTALREMRSLLFELRPGEEVQGGDIPVTLTGVERIRHYGLLGALRLLAEDFSHEGIKVRVEADEAGLKYFGAETVKRSGEEARLEESLYRIAQESLNNASKHARARQSVIRIGFDVPDLIRFSASDDGIGFDPDSRGSGFGMKTMRERAEAIHATLRVESTPGAGTLVEVLIPLKETRV
ncbi:MAG: GAF domain-containing sensor histidine kinase [Chloroflexota bacterium]